MSRRYPDEPIFTGLNEIPTRLEANVTDLEVHGEIPAAIAGSFYRVQPDPEYAPFVENDIFFNGDGLVSAFHFANGKVDLVQRYAQTDRLVANRSAGRQLFGHYRNPFSDDPASNGISGTTSNTHVFVHGGHLLAMKEDGMPTVMDPVTLETRSTQHRFGGITADSFTAHPKVDPVSGQMIAFGYEAKGLGSTALAYYEIDKKGALTRELMLDSPYPGMIHDWGVTQNFVIFPMMPLVSDVERMKAGKPRFVWRPQLKKQYGIMRRDGDGSDLKWFELPTTFLAHTFNAFDDGDKVYLDMTVPSDNVFDFFPDDDGNSPHMMSIELAINRFCFDMNAGSISTQTISSPDRVLGEFLHIDDRYATLPYSKGFLCSIDPNQDYDYDLLGPPGPQFFNGLATLDMASGDAERWWCGPQSCTQEPVFVPRSPDAPEGDGYVIAVVNQLAERRSELVILDTANFAAGPVATCKIPFRLRNALHGNWVPAEVRDAAV